MHTLTRLIVAVAVMLLTGAASAQTRPRPARPGHKLRIKIDSQPQQAAIYIDSKEYGIEGYTPTTLKLPKGSYTIIMELPGFKPVQRPINVTRSEGFIFTLERAARPAVVEVRSVATDSATGGQLFVDGAMVGTVPGKSELAAGSHLVEVKKAGFKDFRESVTVAEGETRTLMVDLLAEAKKGSILVVSDTAGADVYVDGTRRDATPALIGDLIEGAHTVEVRKDPLQPWKQVVTVVGNQQTKIEARLAAPVPEAPKGGSLRIVCQSPGAEVMVDGEPKGPANSEIANVRPGQHIIEVRAPNFAPQVIEVTVVAGEQRLARVDLQPQAAVVQTARLRVVTPVPDAEVFIDGASVGLAPVDRDDLAPGKHYVVVRHRGYAEWKREVDLNPQAPTTLTVELSASGILKVLSNVPGAQVFVDGQFLGKTPATLAGISAGDHLIEVKAPGYIDARQPVRLEGGDERVMSADLAPVRTGMSSDEQRALAKGMSSFSAVTLHPARFTLDLAGGFIPFFAARLTVGAWRKGNLGLDAGVSVSTMGTFTIAGAHAKFQFLKAGPVAIGANLFLGGGGGPAGRSNFTFELGLPISLLFGNVVRFTVHPYLQAYSDRNCPGLGDYPAMMRDAQGVPNSDAGNLYKAEPDSCKDKDGRRFQADGVTRVANDLPLPTGLTTQPSGQDPRDRFGGARLMLRAALEIAVHQSVSIFFIFEGDPVGQRQAYTDKFTGYLPKIDNQIYGQAGVTFKF